jgi:hypothetical protein
MGAETQNAVCDVLRGSTSNWAGDEVDANEPYITGLPVTLVETGKSIQDPSTPTPRIIREVLLIAPAYAGLLDTDRIRDQATGNIYMIMSVTRPPTIIGAPTDRVLALKRVSGTGT